MKNKQEIYKITGLVLILDQLIKLIVSNSMKLYQNITIIPNFFSLYYVRNKGAAFSILENNTTLLIVVSVISILVIDSIIKKEKEFDKISIISLGMVLGGIYGNLIDRVIHRSVTDYLSFIIFKYDFPIFNLADIGITVGTFLLLIAIIRKERRKK